MNTGGGLSFGVGQVISVTTFLIRLVSFRDQVVYYKAIRKIVSTFAYGSEIVFFFYRSSIFVSPFRPNKRIKTRDFLQRISPLPLAKYHKKYSMGII